MSRSVSTILILFGAVQLVNAQFVPTLLQNHSYWGDGKSEIDFYQAEFVREGEPHACELVMVLTPLFVAPNDLAPVADNKTPGAVPAIRMNNVAAVPRGVSAELRAFEALWRMDSMSLARLSFIGNDSFGNIAKTISESRQSDQITWTFSCESYLRKADPAPIKIGTKPTVAYDELPLRVRTIDFGKPTGEAEIDVAGTLGSVSKDFEGLKPAKISWKTGERAINVEVQHAAGRDAFVVDANFPFLLREWRAADGTHWKMKNSIRADYRKYLRNGDRERALKDPMLRHPD
jgi:hypothetical protein